MPESVCLEELLGEITVDFLPLYYDVTQLDGLVGIERVAVLPGLFLVSQASEDDPEAGSEFFARAP